MRRGRLGTVAALGLVPLLALTAGAWGADKKEDACHGTSIEFVDTPKEAATLAKKEQKLVFVLHVSGHFEDPRFT